MMFEHLTQRLALNSQVDGFCSEKSSAVIRISSVLLWFYVACLLQLLLDFEIGFPPVLLQKMQFRLLAMAPM